MQEVTRRITSPGKCMLKNEELYQENMSLQEVARRIIASNKFLPKNEIFCRENISFVSFFLLFFSRFSSEVKFFTAVCTPILTGASIAGMVGY